MARGNVTRSCTLISCSVHFKKISYFESKCVFRNNEVQFAGEIQPKGCHYLLEVPLGDQKVVLKVPYANMFRFLFMWR